MPEQLIETPQDIDAALAQSVQAGRERLVRRIRNQRIRTRVAFALSGCIGIFALAACVSGDYAAAARKSMTEELRKYDQSL
jgi:hypothetical protein